MWQVCIFGGTDARITPDKRVYLTLFGGADLKRPTLAQRMLAARAHDQASNSPPPACFVVTIFAGTSVSVPTLAEEYIDYRSMLEGGTLSLVGWDRDVARVHEVEGDRFSTFTLFGGFDGDDVPEDSAEIDALATHRHLGHISSSAGAVLQMGFGLHGAQRFAVLRQALQEG